MARNIKQICAASFHRYWVLYFLLILLLMAGGIFGTWSATGLAQDQASELQDQLTAIFETSGKASLNPTKIFENCLFRNVTLIGFVYIAGLSVIGIPVMLSLIFVRGFALGFAACLVISRRGLAGIPLVLTSLAPHNLLLIPALVFAGAASLSFSLLLIRRGFDPRIPIARSFWQYTLFTLYATAVVITAAFIESFVTPYLLQFTLTILE
ncbi:MAG: stage II sporulation protein M [Peptococcaceae bacterium]|nr:stage II sporulation protein M [Peptococcaceae bacterium]